MASPRCTQLWFYSAVILLAQYWISADGRVACNEVNSHAEKRSKREGTLLLPGFIRRSESQVTVYDGFPITTSTSVHTGFMLHAYKPSPAHLQTFSLNLNDDIIAKSILQVLLYHENSARKPILESRKNPTALCSQTAYNALVCMARPRIPLGSLQCSPSPMPATISALAKTFLCPREF